MPAGGGSGQDVVQRRREPLARLLELALDVQACRAGLGPQVEEVGPAWQVRIVGLGDRLDLVDLARRQHQRLGAVVLDATAQVLDCEPLARRGAEVSYEVTGEDGPPHERTYTVLARVDGRELGSGSGRSKKHAEQEAARAAVDKLASE